MKGNVRNIEVLWYGIKYFKILRTFGLCLNNLKKILIYKLNNSDF